MKTVFLLVILAALTVIALKDPNETFWEAAGEMVSTTRDMITSSLADSKKDSGRDWDHKLGGQFQVLKERIGKLGEDFHRSRDEVKTRDDVGKIQTQKEADVSNKSETQLLSSREQMSNLPEGVNAPVGNAELPEFLPGAPVDPVKETPDGRNLSDVGKLYEEASRLLAEIK